MKKILPFLIICALSTCVFAETIKLTSGKTITGKILEKNDKSVKIDVDGTTVTYYMDEIDSIDGQSAASAPEVNKVEPTAAETIPEVEAPMEDKRINNDDVDGMEPAANVSGSKKALILKFIDVFGTKSAMKQNLDSMLITLPEDNPQYQKLKNDINVNDIIDRLVPIYDKEFNESELKAYIEFYSSPQGRKLINGIANIMRESVDVSAEYFREKFPETATEE